MKDYTDITVLIDESGSMGGQTAETINAYNVFVDEQKKVAGEALLTLATFDTTRPLFIHYEGVRLPDVERWGNYRPNGGTPLHDAVGQLITRVGHRLSLMPEAERPNKVLFVIITDGYENASRTYDGPKIAEMIKHQTEKYGWQFLYLGANQDAILTGQNINIPNSVNVNLTTNAGTRGSYAFVGQAATAYRGQGATAMWNVVKSTGGTVKDADEKTPV